MDLERELSGELGAAPEDRGSVAQANPFVAELQQAWANEKSAPELFSFRKDLVDRISAWLDAQSAQLAQPDRNRSPFVQGLYQLDVDRVKYILAAYLRTRLGKVRVRPGARRLTQGTRHAALTNPSAARAAAQIQKWYLHIITTPTAQDRLSDAERRFLADFEGARRNHFNTSVFSLITKDNFPASEHGYGGEATLREGPSDKVRVFARANQELEPQPWFTSDDVAIAKGKCFIVTYDKIKGLVARGEMSLMSPAAEAGEGGGAS